MGELFKQIANVDSTIKLIAFLASIAFLIVSVIVRYSNRISKRAGNILIIFVCGIFLLAGIALLIPRPDPHHEDKLTLNLTLADNFGQPYQYGQADVTVGNKKATVDYSGSVWTVVIAREDLPPDRGVYLTARTKDGKFAADTLILLKEDPVQRLILRLRGEPPLPVTGFSMNLRDNALRQTIAKLTGLTYDAAARKNRVFVTYETANIRPIHGDGPYYFVGSSPVVLIDDRKYILEDCDIPQPVPNSASDKEVLRNLIQEKSVEVATDYFRGNPKILAKWIKP